MIRKAIAASRLDQRSVGSPFISTKPRPLITSSSNFRRRGARLGRDGESVTGRVGESANCRTAVSTSAISVSDRCSIQSVFAARSEPYHAEESRTGGGRDISFGETELTIGELSVA